MHDIRNNVKKISINSYNYNNAIYDCFKNLLYKVLIMLSADFYFAIQYCYRMDRCIQALKLSWLFATCSLEQ